MKKTVTIEGMLLQRRLVVMLRNYYINNGFGISREEFVKYVADKIWPRLYYCWPKKEKFRNLINLELGYCIRGDLEYISEDDDGKKLLVTSRGNNFISITSLGFYEEFRKRRKRSTDIFHERIIGGLITVLFAGIVWAFSSFWPVLKKLWLG
ncbi:MAG: hypothetical protein UT43_C0002G0006 [Parcubacteria group bacterium GW2011_GWC1_39_29]|nr:MAG: hypothetical protein UT43_C0002G0006 [Parcubacteria group bacterium GW2011_GWC1_39_29]